MLCKKRELQKNCKLLGNISDVMLQRICFWNACKIESLETNSKMTSFSITNSVLIEYLDEYGVSLLEKNETANLLVSLVSVQNLCNFFHQLQRILLFVHYINHIVVLILTDFKFLPIPKVLSLVLWNSFLKDIPHIWIETNLFIYSNGVT